MEQWPWLIAGTLFTALILAVGHWAPWEPPLPKLARYVYGVSAIICGFAVWRSFCNDWQTPLALLIIAAVSGGTVFVCYRIDALVIAIRKAQKAERNDDELR